VGRQPSPGPQRRRRPGASRRRLHGSAVRPHLRQEHPHRRRRLRSGRLRRLRRHLPAATGASDHAHRRQRKSDGWGQCRFGHRGIRLVVGEARHAQDRIPLGQRRGQEHFLFHLGVPLEHRDDLAAQLRVTCEHDVQGLVEDDFLSLAQRLGFGPGAGAQSLAGIVLAALGLDLDVLPQIAEVGGCGVLQAAADGVVDVGLVRRLGEQAFQIRDGLAICFFGEGFQPAIGAAFDPLRGYEDDLFVQAGGARAEQGQAADADHSGDGVARVAQYRHTAEIVCCPALRSEARQNPLDEWVLQVKLNDLVVHVFGRNKGHGAQRALAPVPESLVALARGAKCVEGVLPGVAEFGQIEGVWRPRPDQGLLAGKSQPHIERLAEQARLEAHDPARVVQDTRDEIDLGAGFVHGLFRAEFTGHGHILLVHALGLVEPGLRVWADAIFKDVGQSGGHDLAQAAEIAADALDLLDEDLEDMVLGPLGIEEVVAADFRLALKGPIHAAVSLFQPRRIPRHIEMEDVGAVALKVHALTGGIGCQQNAHRVLVWWAVECSLHLLALGQIPGEI